MTTTKAPSVLEVRHVLENAKIAVRLTRVEPTPTGVRVHILGTSARKPANVDRVRLALDTAPHGFVIDTVGRSHVLHITRVTPTP